MITTIYFLRLRDESSSRSDLEVELNILISKSAAGNRDLDAALQNAANKRVFELTESLKSSENRLEATSKTNKQLETQIEKSNKVY